MRFLPARTSARMSTPAAPLATGVQVVIPAALNRPTHTLYSVCVSVQPTLQEWCVNRRYSQFLQLRDDILATLLGCKSGCPSCASFALSIKKFAFPRKTWIRTNRIVRKRVKSLQLFVQLLSQRLFNDLPKCAVCGDQVKKMVRPFLIRGAQPMGDSTVDKIQHSLSLMSYAIVNHKFKSRKNKQSPHQSTKNSSENDTSYTSTERTGSDPALDSPTPAVDFSASTRSDDSYGQQYGDERCTDQAVPLEEAMKQVVLLDKRSSTVEEVAFRLSSMWGAYDLDEVMAAAPELKLSFTDEFMEENEAEDTGDEGAIDILGGDTDDEDDNNASLALLQDNENNVSLALLQDNENNVSLALLQDNENNVSFAVLQDENMYDENDDDEREAEPQPIDEVTL